MLRSLFVLFFMSISVLLYSQSKEEQIENLRADVEELAHKKYRGREAGCAESRRVR